MLGHDGRCWIRVLGVLPLLALAACGTEGAGDRPTTTVNVVVADTEWSSFVGETDNGTQVRIGVDDRGGVLFSWDGLGCATTGGDTESTVNGADPLDASGFMTDDGFVANAQMDYDFHDGDYSRYEVEVVGRLDGKDSMSGTVKLVTTSVNGQAKEFDDSYEPRECTSDPVAWSATFDDPTIARTMWLFRDTARNDLHRFDELVAAGVALDAQHPIRGTTLSENVDEACVYDLSGVYDSDGIWLSFDDGEASVRYPTRGAEETIDALVGRGVPAPDCGLDAEN